MKKSILTIAVFVLSAAAAFAQAKGDPWIKKIYNDTYHRDPNVLEYNIQNYNNGHWNNYQELQKYISEYTQNLSANGLSLKISDKNFGNNKVVGIYQNGQAIAVDLVSLDGGNIVAQGGGNLVAAGGGNLVAAGGGNLVAAGGGNIIAQGGGNIVANIATKGAGFGGAYTIQSTGMKVIKTSGSGAMIIK